MEFLESFWATMWGALAGALVGAAAAYGFALDLARRDRRNRLSDDAQRRDADERARYQALIPMHVTRVVEGLHRYADELRQRPRFVATRPLNEVPPPPRHTALAQLLSSIDTAIVHARNYERRVFETLRGVVRSVGDEGDVERIIAIMLDWQVTNDLEMFVVDELETLAQAWSDEAATQDQY